MHTPRVRFAALFMGALALLIHSPLSWAESPPVAEKEAAAGKLPQEIPLDHPGIRYIGRFTEDRTCEWTGSQMVFTFEGQSAEVEIVGQSKPWSNNYFRIDVDGQMTKEFNVTGGRKTIRVADSLPKGRHVVRLFRQTEPLYNATTIAALRLDADAKMGEPLPPAERTLLAIGDSITAGYGNAASKPEEGFKADQQKGDRTYSALAAQMFGADYHCVAWSGRGMHINRGKNSKPGVNTIPVNFEDILPTQREKSPKFDFKSIKPDVITINLGTNDFDHKELPKEEFSATYIEFIKKLHGWWPEARIICISGSMVGAKGKPREAVEAAAEGSGSDKVSFLLLTRDGAKEGLGGHHHPSLATHEANSKVLAEEIARVTGWPYQPTH